jgi:hypothetical protein
MTSERQKLLLLRVAAGLAVSALVALAAWTRAAHLLADPYPLGVDGHYYAVQVRALLEQGRLNYPAAPLTFWLLAPLGHWLGPIDGVKWGAALGTALAAWPAYHLAARVSHDRAAPQLWPRLMGLAGAMIVATSASSIFLSVEFIKQGLGLSFALAQLAALAAWLEHPTRPRLALTLGLALAALLVHKSSLGLIALVGGVALVAAGKLDRRRALLGALVVLVLLAASALFPARLPGMRDLPLLGTAFSTRPSFALVALDRGAAAPLVFAHEALIAALAAPLAIPLYLRARTSGRAPSPLVPGIIVFALLQGIPWLDVADRQGLAFRLRVSAFVALPVLVPFVVSELLALLDVARALRLLAPLTLIVVLAGLRPWSSDEGAVHAHPALVQAARAVRGAVPEDAEVITQDRQLAFMVRFYAGVHTRLHVADAPPGAPLYRLFSRRYFMRPSFLTALAELGRAPPPGLVLPVGLHPSLEDGDVIMPEATWQLLRTRLSPADQRYYDAWPTS